MKKKNINGRKRGDYYCFSPFKEFCDQAYKKKENKRVKKMIKEKERKGKKNVFLRFVI